VLERIVDTTRIFEAWSDEEWVNDGAAVRVSLSSPAPTTPPSASCIPASTNSGRCASAPRSKTDPRYTPTTTFETFPFPAGLTPRDTGQAGRQPPRRPAWPMRSSAANIAAAARRLNELRENWLNPPEWVERVPEVVPGFPDRIVPKPEHAAELKKRTLTNLYNQRPAWLDNAHKVLDAAVAAAYGWADYTPEMPDEEILRRLLALNLTRANTVSMESGTPQLRSPSGPAPRRSLQRFPIFIQDAQIRAVGKYAVAALAGEFMHHAEIDQGLHRLGGGGETQAAVGGEVFQAGQRALAQAVEHA
jgi:hypothetical protein